MMLTLHLFADKPPIKFGNVSREELEMTVYEPDSSAAAVILCDYGYFNALNYTFTQVTRIKILKKEGYVYADRVFPPYATPYVRGITFNLENGEVSESKLKAESIFTERIYEKIERIRITMPNVKVGSVIDIEFTHNSLPAKWRFQQNIPVKWSELVMENSLYVSYTRNLFGFYPLKLQESNHWIGENMPAFKPEPFITSPENYLTKIEFDILDVKAGMYYEAVTTSWEDLSDLLYDFTRFGEPLRNSAYLGRAAKDILETAKTDEEKLRMAHEFIKTFKWNKDASLLTSNSSIAFAFEKKSGNSADVNIALIQLLDKIGFQVEPVLMSTRDNGFLSPAYPSLNKLNYVIARVKLNDQELLIDGTEEYAPYNLLPERCLNIFGRTYNDKTSDVVSLSTSKKDKEMIYYTLTLDDMQQFTGNLNIQRFDYAALDFRIKYHSFTGEEAFLENMLAENAGLRITEAIIENVDSLYLPIKEKYSISLKNLIHEAGGNLYFNPLLLHSMKENYFKTESRSYPVDFVHNLEKICIVNITIPENYEIIGLPESINMKLPDNSAYFYYQVTSSGQSIQVSFKMGTNKTIFVEDEYQDIKEFFNLIVTKHAEPVTLKKK
jgi:hypothetical protein